MNREQELLDQMEPLRHELDKIARKKRQDENTAYVGKCFRYRNSYSCPESEADYWWLYAMVTGLSDSGQPVGISFQTDKNGDIEFKSKLWFTGSAGYEEISGEAFAIQFDMAINRTIAMRDTVLQRQESTE